MLSSGTTSVSHAKNSTEVSKGTTPSALTATPLAIRASEHRMTLEVMTIWPAWQHFEADSNGTIEVVKLADLVISSINSNAVDTDIPYTL